MSISALPVLVVLLASPAQLDGGVDDAGVLDLGDDALEDATDGGPGRPSAGNPVWDAPPPGSAAEPAGGEPGAGEPAAGEPSAAEEAVTLEAVELENRLYFRDSTARTFFKHAVPAPLDLEQLEADRAALEGAYKDRGFLFAEVGLRLEPGEQPFGRKAVMVIEAGDRAPLKAIAVVGNVLVEDADLLVGLQSKEPSPLGAFAQAGIYHKPWLEPDSQKLLSNYYSFGHLEARVVGTRVVARPDMDGVELVFDVVEGPVYELIDLSFDGDIPDNSSAEQLRRMVTIRDGQVANLIEIQKNGEEVLDIFRESGHPFARAEQQVVLGTPPSGDTSRRGISLRYTLVKGPAAKVRNIIIKGNEGLVETQALTPGAALFGTWDHVIRRDVQLDEGDDYQHSKLEATRKKLMGTGYFANVEVRPVPVAEEGKVDIEVQVMEQPTWLFNITPWFIANEGIILIGILADRNIVGTGLSVSMIGQLSFQRQLFNLSVTEPRLLDTRIQVTAEVHRRELGYRHYIIRSEAGGGFRVNFPLYFDGVFLGTAGTVEYGGVVNYLPDFVNTPELPLGSDLLPQLVFRNVPEVSFVLDKRDSLLSPRNGVYATASASYAGPFTLSGLAFLGGEANLRLYWSPLWNITFKTSTSAGYLINPHGGEVPVTDRYFLGGYGSVRGYRPRSIAPTIPITLDDGTVFEVDAGGTRRLVQNTEVEFPLWPDTPFRGFVFLDFGNAWKDNEPLFTLLGEGLDRDTDVLPLGMFYSVGAGILIQTPVFPFRFEWSIPLTRRPYDRPFDFFFGVGSAF